MKERERKDGCKGEDGWMEGGGWASSSFVVVVGGRDRGRLWAVGIVWRWGTSFVGSWCRVGAGNVVLGQWALFGGEECHLGAGGIVCGHGALFVGMGSRLRAGDVVWVRGALFEGGGCRFGAGVSFGGRGGRLGVVGVVWGRGASFMCLCSCRRCWVFLWALFMHLDGGVVVVAVGGVFVFVCVFAFVFVSSWSLGPGRSRRAY